MPKWLVRRLGTSCLVFVAALAIAFFVPRLMPGDITDIYAEESFHEETRLKLFAQFGLDKSLWTQFLLYLKNTFTGNFGLSFLYYPRPVSNLLANAIPKSLILILGGQAIYTIIGYFLGVTAGWKAGSKTDSTITGVSMFIWAAPMFWVAIIILYVVAFSLGWFPLAGFETIGASYGLFQATLDRLYHLFLPMLTLVICRFGAAQMVMRNTLTITLKENYVTTAHAKGLSERRVKHRHAARNALLPLVTSSTMGIAFAFSGSIFIETIFSYPGVGRLIFQSVIRGDYPVLQACFLATSVMVIVLVLLLDLLYARLDPRVRY